MAWITPGSTINVYKVPHIDDNETIIGTSQTQVDNYIAGYSKLENVSCTYVRKKGQLKLRLTASQMQTLDTCNLIGWNNPSYENKQYYARITSWDMVNNQTAVIGYVIDWWLTFGHTLSYGSGMIGREHLSESDYNTSLSNPWDPGIYEFQTSEGVPVTEAMLEVGEVVQLMFPEGGGNPYICLKVAAINKDTFPGGWDKTVLAKTTMYIAPDGTYKWGSAKGTVSLRVPRAYWTLIYASYNVFQRVLDILSAAGAKDNIIGVTMCPQKIIERYRDTTEALINIYNKPGSPGGRHNTKLALSPFQFLRVVNDNGDTKDYQFERFGSGDEYYMSFLAMLDDAYYTSLVPINYGYDGSNLAERIDSAMFPEIGYSTDSYLSFVATQFQSNLAGRTTVSEQGSIAGQGNLAITANEEIAEAAGQTAGFDWGKLKRIGGQVVKGAGNVASAIMQKDPGRILDTVDIAANAYATQEESDVQTYANANIYTVDPILAAKFYGPAKSGFVLDHYTPGTSAANLAQYMDDNMCNGNFKLVVMRMKSSILDVYNEMFDRIGYASNRYGQPRVLHEFLGGTKAHYVNGYTYVQCGNLHVEGGNKTCCQSISNMFAAGQRFYKI